MQATVCKGLVQRDVGSRCSFDHSGRRFCWWAVSVPLAFSGQESVGEDIDRSSINNCIQP